MVSGDPAKAAKVAADHKLPKRSIYAYRDFDRMRDIIEAIYRSAREGRTIRLDGRA